jgi:hypothetical protein
VEQPQSGTASTPSPSDRKQLVAEFGLDAFARLYFPEHLTLRPSNFQAEMEGLMADRKQRRLAIIGFRGSAKSTIGSLIYPIYAALEQTKTYPFIILVSDTMTQSGINMANIRQELETNELLRTDYGKVVRRDMKNPNPDPTLQTDDEWQSRNIVLNNGVRILARSRGQKVRGLKHRQYRPKLVIVDDPEDTNFIRFKENRDASEKWLRGEVIPALDERTGKVILIGNYLHDDALMARAKKWGTFLVKEYPLIDKDGFCTWPAKYPNNEALQAARADAGMTSWMREYLLKVVPEEGAPITADDIHYYDELPASIYFRGLRGHGVDFAISLKASADCTTCVHGDVYWEGNNNETAFIYILPNPLNARIDFAATLDYLKNVPRVQGGGAHIFYPEDVGYQKAAIQEMERARMNVLPIHPTIDKLARFRTVAPHIKNGTVKFPRHGCEELIDQMCNFGVANHDDLVDGITNLLLGLLESGLALRKFVIL